MSLQMGFFGGVGIPSTPPSGVMWGGHLFVDEELGNDLTGTRNDLVFKYETHEAALADAFPFDTIHHLNGSPTIVAGLWGGIDNLYIHLHEGVTINGESLNRDIEGGCRLFGNGIVNDAGIFIDAAVGHKTHFYFEAYQFNFRRWQCDTGADFEIKAYDSISFTEYSLLYVSQYHCKITASALNFNNPVGGGFYTMQFQSVAGSTVEINAPMFINGVYVRGLDIVGDGAGNWETDLVYNGSIIASGGSTIGECLVRAYGTHNYTSSIANKVNRIQVNGDLINLSGGNARNIYCSAGYVEHKGLLYNNVTGLPMVVLDADQPTYDVPSSILFDTEIDADGNLGMWATDGIIAIYADSGGATGIVFIKWLKMLCSGAGANIGIESDTAGAVFEVQGIQIANVVSGVNVVASLTAWTNAPITF